MNNTIANKIKELREKSDFSLNELAEMVGLTKQSIHKFENGIVNPSNETLMKLADVFNVSFSYFFENLSQHKIDLKSIKFREKSKIENKAFEIEVKEDVCTALSKLLELEDVMCESPTFYNPLEDVIISTDRDIEKAAKVLRKKWKIGNGPIKDVIETLENKGLYVVEISRFEDFSGLCGIVNETIPIIVLNSYFKSIERKRFTALHELGHLVLQFSEDLSDNAIEKFCDKFAGAVLLVDETLLEELGKNRTVISLAELRELKELYGISIQAIIMRARQTGLVSYETSNDWWKSYEEWNNDETKVNDFGNYNGIEKTRRFKKLLIRGLNERRISISKAAELSGKKIDVLKKELQSELIFNLN